MEAREHQLEAALQGQRSGTNTNTIAFINYQSLDVENHLILYFLQIMKDIFVPFKIENAATMENITVGHNA